mgnify:CR=1 FL=1
MKDFLQEKILHNFFEAIIFIKGIAGGLEILIGSLFLFLDKDTIYHFFIYLANHRLISFSENANNYFEHQANALENTQTFIAVYFLFYGILNIFLLVCLLRNKLWAYPFSILFFSLFNLYLLYRFFAYRSGTTLFFIIFNIFFIILIWVEYRRLKAKKAIKI